MYARCPSPRSKIKFKTMIVNLKIFPWGETVVYDSGNWGLEIGDKVIVNADSETEIATVEKINIETEEKEKRTEEIPKIIRKATIIDLEAVEKNKRKSVEIIKTCRDLVNESKLPMKIVAVHLGFSGGKITFSFIAESRVDFRELVKKLSKKFQRSVRLHQIGSRDEAREKGGFGVCGCQLCCARFLKDLPSITTEDARVQQMEHRGSERVSGLCGRLKCCLGFETKQYRELLKNMPKTGETITVNGKKCVITELDVLSQKVIIKFEDGNKRKVSLDDLK